MKDRQALGQGNWLTAATEAFAAAVDARDRRVKAARASAARNALQAHVLAVTGSSAKSTTVGLITHILAAQRSVSALVYHNTLQNLQIALAGFPRDIEHAVLELGVGKPGDMAPLAALARPDMAVVTLVGREHYSAFRGHAAVAAEKGMLVEALGADGLAILNADDELAVAMAARTRARIVTFGRDASADYRVVATEVGYPESLAVTIEAGGRRTVLQTRFAGAHYWLPVAAAFASARELGIDATVIADRMATFQPSLVRGRVIAVENGPTFIVDTVKAPYDTLGLAFDMVKQASAPWKRIVLGQISDYPGSAGRTYARAYREAREAADEVIFVGDNSHRSKASAEDRAGGRFREFVTPRQVAEHIRLTARPGELILLKGSPNLHLERIALDWLTDVRCWKPVCGLSPNCGRCGLYWAPFQKHRAVLREFKRRRLLKRLQFWRPRESHQSWIFDGESTRISDQGPRSAPPSRS